MSQTIAMSCRDFAAIRSARKAAPVEPEPSRVVSRVSVEPERNLLRAHLVRLARMYQADPSVAIEAIEESVLSAAPGDLASALDCSIDRAYEVQGDADTCAGIAADMALEADARARANRHASGTVNARVLARTVGETAGLRGGHLRTYFDPDLLLALARECRSTGFVLECWGDERWVTPAQCRALAGILGTVSSLLVDVWHEGANGDGRRGGHRLCLRWVEQTKGRATLHVAETVDKAPQGWEPATVRLAA